MKKTMFGTACWIGITWLVTSAQMQFPYVLQGTIDLGMNLYGEADFNLDGYRDLAASGYDYQVNVYSGKDFTILKTIPVNVILERYMVSSVDADLDFYPDIVLAQAGMVTVYSLKRNSLLYQAPIGGCSSVDWIGDLNSDSINDILAAGSYGSWIISGKDGSVIHALGALAEYGIILALEDVDGDGKKDVAVSSDRTGYGDPNGAIALFSGATGDLISVIEGNGAGFGNSIATLPDQDGDGKADLLVALTGSADSALIYSSVTSSLIGAVTFPYGDPGVFGSFMDNLEDFDGDNVSDFVICDLFGSVENDQLYAGASFIFSGVSRELLYSFYGVPFSDFGLSVTSLGDLNNDGRKELAIGAPLDNKVYIFSAYIPGDANQDGRITLADVVIKIRFLFHNGPRPLPMSVADDNCDGTISLSDIICTLNYIFGRGTQGCCIK